MELTARASVSFPLSEPPGAEDFPLVQPGGKAAAICVPAGEDPAVRRAANDLADDVERVSGVRPAIVENPAAATGNAVILHTLPKGQAESESWTAETAAAPDALGGDSIPGRRTLTIAGGDRRGTIFGIYTLSESIGVSPWYWWADVPPVKHATLAIRASKYAQPAPAVKYRGIFLNDEDWGLRPWAAGTFEPDAHNIGPKTYAKIFELLLRLKANTLWPAMHPGSTAFNDFPADAPQAEAYGIVMGSSHCEQMLRNNVGEWNHETYGDYNYVTNKAGVLRYWEERVKSNAKYDSLYTLGMRGIHDGGMPGGGTVDEKAARMHEIVNDQRALLAKYINPDVSQVPQILCPYKEVLAIYRRAPDYPEDITLVWPDDNYGYIRQVSNPDEQKRAGGAGVYYHISYWGAPHDYLWLNTTPPALIWEEMTKAFDYGAKRVWIVNVGDLKPGELGMEYFLRLAWDPHAVGPENADALLGAGIERDFGKANAGEIVAILRDYYRFNWNRKPEFQEAAPGKSIYSLMRKGHDEIAERLDAGRRLRERADALEAKLQEAQRAAYYQLVLYPVRGSVAMNEKWLGLARYYAYQQQGRADALKSYDQARAAFETIERETAYYNDTLSGGKWRGMMSDHPRDLGVFKMPKPLDAAAAPQPGEPAADTASQPADDDERIVLQPRADQPAGNGAAWKPVAGLGESGGALAVFPVTFAGPDQPEQIRPGTSPGLSAPFSVLKPGAWTVELRTLPTWPVTAGRAQRYAVSVDAEPPVIVSLPLYKEENDPRWQQDVLRNAAFTESVHQIDQAGAHVLHVWAVDPGVVVDTIAVAPAHG